MKKPNATWLALLIALSPFAVRADGGAMAADEGDIIYMERFFVAKGDPSLRVAMEQKHVNGVDYCRAIYASFMGKKFISGARVQTLETCKSQLIPDEGRLNFVVPLSGWNNNKYDLYWLPIPEGPVENDYIKFSTSPKRQDSSIKVVGINWRRISPEQVMKKFPFDEANQQKTEFEF